MHKLQLNVVVRWFMIILAVCLITPTAAHADNIFDGMTNTWGSPGFESPWIPSPAKDGITELFMSAGLDYRTTSYSQQCYVWYCIQNITGNITPDNPITLTFVAGDPMTYTFVGRVHGGTFSWESSWDVYGDFAYNEYFGFFFSAELGDWHTVGYGWEAFAEDEGFGSTVTTATQAPEPSTITFLGLGLAGLYSRIRRYL